MNEKLLLITKNQKTSLKKLGFNPTDKTTIVQALQWLRNPSSDGHSPLYVRVHVSAYFVAEVFGYLTMEEQLNNTGKRWYSYGVHTWEAAESIALDYMLNMRIKDA